MQAHLWEALAPARELWVQSDTAIPRVPASSLTPESFSALVALNRPVIICGALDAWPAYQKWDVSYLRARYGGARVTYNVTPTGWGDAAIPVANAIPSSEADAPASVHWFVKPEERSGSLAQALDAVLDPSAAARGEIAYVSFQNDSLRAQIPAMMAELGEPVSGSGGGSARAARSRRCLFPFSPWSTPIGDGTGADAINVWIGSRYSVSSSHKDHFENLYAVLRGRKYFTLCPPCDVLWLGVKQLPAGRFKKLGGAVERPLALAEKDDGFRNGRRDTPCPRCGGYGLLRRLAPDDACGAGDGSLPHPPPPCASWCVETPFPALDPDGALKHGSGCNAFSWGVVPELEAPPEGGATATSSPPQQQVTVPWVTVDPARVPSGLEGGAPGSPRPTVFHVEVAAGEVLYLPSLWYHRVGQEGGGAGDTDADGEVTIAVNAWFDMQYTGPAYSYYRMCQALAEAQANGVSA